MKNLLKGYDKVILIVLTALVLSVVVYRSSLLNFNYVEVESIELTTPEQHITIGSSPGSDIVIYDSYISPSHFQINFEETGISLANISPDRQVLVNNRYLSTVAVKNGDVLNVLDRNYTFIGTPLLIGTGIFGRYRSDDGKIRSFISIPRKYIRLSSVFPDDNDKELLANYNLRIEFRNRSVQSLYDLLIALTALVAFWVIKQTVGLITAVTNNQEQGFRRRKVKWFIISATSLIFIGMLLVIPFRALDLYDTNVKTFNYRADDHQYITLNSNASAFTVRSLPYNRQVPITIGFTRFMLHADKQEDHYRVRINPNNLRSFFPANISSAASHSSSDTRVNIPYIGQETLLQMRKLPVRAVTTNEQGTFRIYVSSVSEYMKKYYIYIGWYVLLNLIIMYGSLVFKYDYIYFWIFSTILLQGIIVLDQYSFFYPFDNHVIRNFNRNIRLGVAWFALLYVITNFNWFFKVLEKISDLAGVQVNSTAKKVGYIALLLSVLASVSMIFIGYLIGNYTFVTFAAIMLILIIFLSKRLLWLKPGANICFLKWHIPNVPAQANNPGIGFIAPGKLLPRLINWKDNERRNRAVGLNAGTVGVIMSFIIYFLVLQWIKGDELGFNFLGTSFQFLEAFKVIIVFIIIAGYYNILNEQIELNHPITAWQLVIVVTAILSVLIGDFSPVIIFAYVFYFHIGYHLLRTGSKYAMLYMVIPFIVVTALIALPLSGLLLFMILLLCTLIVCYFIRNVNIDVKFLRNRLSLWILPAAFALMLVLSYFNLIPYVANKFYRFHYWGNLWNPANYQFLRSLSFMRGGSQLPDMSFVPVLKDDMFFSLYLNRLGIFAFVFLYLTPLIILLYKASSTYFEYQTKDQYKKWLSLQILFVTILYFVQNYIVLSNASGLLPIMGQPAPGLSYSASHMIFFYFGILYLLVKLNKELKMDVRTIQ